MRLSTFMLTTSVAGMAIGAHCDPAMAQIAAAAGASRSPALAQDAGITSVPDETKSTLDPATAPVAEQGQGDIIVTAQRRAENVQRVPLSITALNSEQLATQGIRSVADLGGKVPSLTVQKFNGIVQPFLRGIGSSTSTAGVESSVAVYVDGVYFSRLPSSFFDLASVQRVEVLKGPQGTLFGRNSTGGVINVITRKPSHDTEVSGTLGYGRFDAVDGNLYATTGLGDSAAISLSIVGKTSDGFGKNTANGHRYGYEDSVLTNAKLLWEPSSNTEITIAGFYSWSKNSGNKAAFPGTSSTTLTHYYVDRSDNGVYTSDQIGFYNSISDPDQQDIFHTYGGSVHLDQDIGFAKIVSISGYSHVSQDSQYTEYLPVKEFLVPAYARVDLYTQELQLVSQSGSPLNWILGLYYLDNKTKYTKDTVFDIPLFYGNTPLSAPAQQKVETYAAFAQAGYHLSPSLNLTVGFRYTWDKTSAEGTVGGIQVFAPDTTKVDKASYKVALDYQIGRDLMVYGLFAHGFKSGAYNILTYSSTPTAPEQLDDYEIGFKSQFLDNRIRLNAAAFYYDIKNPQVQLIQNGTTFLSNAGAARVKGAEADLSIKATQGLTFRTSIAYMDAKYTDYKNAPAGRPDFVVGGSIQLPNIDASGNRLPFAAKWSFNIGSDFSLDTPAGKVTLTADWFHNSGYTFEPDQFLRQGAYDLVNAQVRIQASENVALRIWGRNLANERIVAGAASQYGYAGYPWSPAPPLTFGGAVDFKF